MVCHSHFVPFWSPNNLFSEFSQLLHFSLPQNFLELSERLLLTCLHVILLGGTKRKLSAYNG